MVDMLVSEERVAVIARTSGRRGDQAIVNDFVQLIRIDDGRIVEVWNYNWDQRALAEAFPVAA
jgi:ketosteroid isomerase-like protein